VVKVALKQVSSDTAVLDLTLAMSRAQFERILALRGLVTLDTRLEPDQGLMYAVWGEDLSSQSDDKEENNANQ
jgi:hypothetical protein